MHRDKCEEKASSHLEELQNENPLNFHFELLRLLFEMSQSDIMFGWLKKQVFQPEICAGAQNCCRY